MTMNLRCDSSFVQDEGWYDASRRYDDFLRRYKDSHILFLELGVGMNTPVIIKYPFWKMTSQCKEAFYVCLNVNEAWAPKEIRRKSLCINADIKYVFASLKGC